MTFSEKLIALRGRHSMTQSQLAKELHVTRQTVYKWEAGQSYPEAMTLLAMRRLFDISLDILLDDNFVLPERELEDKKPDIASEVKEAFASAVLNAAGEAKKSEPASPKEEAAPEKTPEPAPAQKEDAPKKKKGFFARLFS